MLLAYTPTGRLASLLKDVYTFAGGFRLSTLGYESVVRTRLILPGT